MFFKSLALTDFQSHAQTNLALEKLTVFRGLNGSGKSSIGQALELLLCSRSSATNDRGSGAKEHITRGASGAVIVASIVDPRESPQIVRKMRVSLTEKGGLSRKAKRDDDPGWSGSDWIESFTVPNHKAVLSCLINGRRFVELSPSEQKNLLSAIILPTHYIWPDWLESKCSTAGIRVNWAQPVFEVIAEGYDKAYAQRTHVNRVLSEWKAPEQPDEIPSADKIRTKLRERQQERTEIAKHRDKAVEGFDRAKKRAEARTVEKSAAQAKLQKLRSTEEERTRFKLTDAKLKENQERAGKADRAKKLDSELITISAEMKVTDKALADLQKLSDTPTCPTCRQPITEATVEAIGKPLVKAKDALIRKQRSCQDERKEIGDWEGAARMISSHESAVHDLSVISKNIEACERELEQMSKEEGPLLFDMPNTDEYDEKLRDLDSRIERGNRALYEAGRAAEAQRVYQDALKARALLDQQSATLESLVEYFGPKGVKADLLNSHIGSFQSSMNEVLARWGFECSLSFDPYSFDVKGQSGKLFSLATLSTSQRYRFSVAFQIALAKVSGWKFAVVDGADILDANSRGPLYASLMNSGLDQVIVMQTDNNRKIPAVPDSAFYMLELGSDGITKAERLT